jgi:serine/threonine-protein kinase HipA
MEELIVDVKLWGKDVGAMVWNEQLGCAAFQYDPKFLRSGLDIAPIVMPLKRSRQDMVYQFTQNRNDCFKGLPGLIADSLPDKYGNQIINEWFTAHGLPNEEITPLDRLCYIGTRGMGALEFEPNKNIKELNTSTRLHMEELVGLADKVFNDKVSFRERLIQEDKRILDIFKIGTSAGGAKPKAIIALNERTNEIRSGQVKAPEGFTYWLLKFDGTTYSEHEQIIKNPKGIGNIEYAYYKMATDAGIEMMESRLLKEGDSYHFMTKRYDRSDNGEKIHVQSLAAMNHYDMNARHSYEEIFATLRKLNLGYKQGEELFRRMVFNVVARNHDDHTKNHVFLMNDKGEWSLGPAYDLCYSYTPGGQWTDEHQLSLNGKRGNFTFEDLMSVGRKMDIKNPKEIIEKVVEVVSNWNGYAKDCGVKDGHKDMIGSNLMLIKDNQQCNIEEGKKDLIIKLRESNSQYFITPVVDGERCVSERISKKEAEDFLEGKISPEQLFTKYYPAYSRDMGKDRKR